MRRVTVKEMREIDRKTIHLFGMPALILMEHAGKAVAKSVLKLTSINNTIIVLCGTGNNGGDGLVAARWLSHFNKKVEVLLFGPIKKMSRETKINYRLLQRLCIPVQQISKQSLAVVENKLRHSSLIIDALLGTGIHAPIEGLYKNVIEMANSSRQRIVSVDLPSGFDADAGKPLNCCIKANATVTLGFPKVGFYKKGAKKYTGKIIVADIGLVEGGKL